MRTPVLALTMLAIGCTSPLPAVDGAGTADLLETPGVDSGPDDGQETLIQEAAAAGNDSVIADATQTTHDGASAIDATVDVGASVGCKLGPGALGHGYHSRTVVHGFSRVYTVYLPTTYQPQVGMPLVMALHGGYGSADGMKDYTQLNATAEKHGFIVAYPEGHNRAWNAGDCCGVPQQQDIDDVGFIESIIDDLSTVACVDARRVYVTGMSNGSMMSHRLACELSHRITAIAGVAGQLGTSYLPTCNPPRKISIMHIHGTDDRCAVYDGGVTAGGCTVGPLVGYRVCNASDPPVTDPDNPPPNINCLGRNPYIPALLSTHPPVADTIDHWIAHNACDRAKRQVQTIGAVNVFTYPCADGTELKYFQIIGGGHSWPGGEDSACCEPNRLANRDIDANEEIWRFFSSQVLLPNP